MTTGENASKKDTLAPFQFRSRKKAWKNNRREENPVPIPGGKRFPDVRGRRSRRTSINEQTKTHSSWLRSGANKWMKRERMRLQVLSISENEHEGIVTKMKKGRGADRYRRQKRDPLATYGHGASQSKKDVSRLGLPYNYGKKRGEGSAFKATGSGDRRAWRRE